VFRTRRKKKEKGGRGSQRLERGTLEIISETKEVWKNSALTRDKGSWWKEMKGGM